MARTRAYTLTTAVAGLALLAGCGSAHPARTGLASAPVPAASAQLAQTTSPEPTRCPGSEAFCYSPQSLESAYGVTPLLKRGITGKGETVVLPEVDLETDNAQASPHTVPGTSLRADLAAYDKKFDLPAPSLTIKSSTGTPTVVAPPEEVLDAELVHAMAPGAAIVIDLGRPLSGSAIASAARLGNIVSDSYGAGQSCTPSAVVKSQSAALEMARRRHVTVLASGGDSGAAEAHCPPSQITARNVGLPSSNPLVTAVGGTALKLTSAGQWDAEVVWNDNRLEDKDGRRPPVGETLGAGGGGFSSIFARPSYQDGVPRTTAQRGTPDVAADADRLTAPAIVLVHDGKVIEAGVGGTSASAPQWAGIVALADQMAHRSLGFINAGLYRIGESSRYHQAFHDVTKGNNTVVLPDGKTLTGFSAGPGWDPVSGWGSPDAQVLVPLLAREVRPDDGAGLS